MVPFPVVTEVINPFLSTFTDELPFCDAVNKICPNSANGNSSPEPNRYSAFALAVATVYRSEVTLTTIPTVSVPTEMSEKITELPSHLILPVVSPQENLQV